MPKLILRPCNKRLTEKFSQESGSLPCPGAQNEGKFPFQYFPGTFSFLLSPSQSPVVHAMAASHADKLTGMIMQSSQSGLHICKAKASPCLYSTVLCKSGKIFHCRGLVFSEPTRPLPAGQL